MSLVAYASSDISDSEEETDSVDAIFPLKVEPVAKEPTQHISGAPYHHKLNLPTPKSSANEVIDEVDIKAELFSTLPEPKHGLSDVEEVNDEFLNKKEKPPVEPPPAPAALRKPVKITLQALADFPEEEKGSFLQMKPTVKPSGLLGILPPPKQTFTQSARRSLVPHILTKKLVPQQAKSIPKSSVKPSSKTPATAKPLSNYVSSDESDDESSKSTSDKKSDFFLLNDDYKLPEINYDAETELRQMAEVERLKKEKEEADYTSTGYNDIGAEIGAETLEQSSDNGPLGLDEEAMRQLCGSRGKRSKHENIQIIDMSHEDVLPDKEEWMRTALQEATAAPRRQSHSAKNTGGPTSQQKRKHQITYLAHQAKANELDLQNQWANNRFTKKQTQSKYGF